MAKATAAQSGNAIREQLARALAWHDAHVNLDGAVKGLPPALRGRRPRGSPHSIWELVEHIRLAQQDMIDFALHADYEAPSWPRDYWPSTPEPRSAAAWTASLAACRRDARKLQRIARDHTRPLDAPIPHGTGQTYLREFLLAIDHTAYHVGQIVALRHQLGAWPKG